MGCSVASPAAKPLSRQDWQSSMIGAEPFLSVPRGLSRAGLSLYLPASHRHFLGGPACPRERMPTLASSFGYDAHHVNPLLHLAEQGSRLSQLLHIIDNCPSFPGTACCFMPQRLASPNLAACCERKGGGGVVPSSLTVMFATFHDEEPHILLPDIS